MRQPSRILTGACVFAFLVLTAIMVGSDGLLSLASNYTPCCFGAAFIPTSFKYLFGIPIALSFFFLAVLFQTMFTQERTGGGRYWSQLCLMLSIITAAVALFPGYAGGLNVPNKFTIYLSQFNWLSLIAGLAGSLAVFIYGLSLKFRWRPYDKVLQILIAGTFITCVFSWFLGMRLVLVLHVLSS